MLSASEPFRRKRIMAIDDSRTICLIIEGTLTREGYEVHTFLSGVEALRALSQRQVAKPDLVLLDIGMPEMDGYTVARLFQQKPELKSVKIVMISGHNGIIDKVRGRLAGAQEYIPKPFKSGELVAVVRRVLAGGGG